MAEGSKSKIASLWGSSVVSCSYCFKWPHDKAAILPVWKDLGLKLPAPGFRTLYGSGVLYSLIVVAQAGCI